MTSDIFPVERLGLHLVQDSTPQTFDLANEFGPQLLIIDTLQVLQVFLLLSGPHESKTVSILEKVDNQSSDSVFLFDAI